LKRDKNLKNLELFKKGFRKNEVVIYAIALMLVTAGYFNYTANVENRTVETYSQESTNNDISENDSYNNIHESDSIKASKETSSINANSNNETDENITKNEDINDDDIGDAKLVDSKSVVDDSADYFASTKLQRDTNYADTLSAYTKILEDGSISETQKSIAMKEITKINDTKNAISVCENLLYTKGFEHYVVLVNNESINVVLQVEGGLTKQKVAQIQNIISREFKCDIDNIHISEK